jgi:hypothetical protein
VKQRLGHIIGLALTGMFLSVGVAAAASLGLTSSNLGAGSATVSGCTSSSLTATRNVNNSGNVTQVNVLGVPQACAGETLAVTLENSSHVSLGNSSAVVGACTGGCTVTVTGFGTVSAANLTAYALSLTE